VNTARLIFSGWVATSIVLLGSCSKKSSNPTALRPSLHPMRMLDASNTSGQAEPISLPTCDLSIADNPEVQIEKKQDGVCTCSLTFKDGSRFTITTAVSKAKDSGSYLRNSGKPGEFMSWEYANEFVSDVLSGAVDLSHRQTVERKRKTFKDIKPYSGEKALGFLILERSDDLIAWVWTSAKDRLAVLAGYVGTSNNPAKLEERAWQILSSWQWRELEPEPGEDTPKPTERRIRVIPPTQDPGNKPSE
jgi:hypothetical protein